MLNIAIDGTQVAALNQYASSLQWQRQWTYGGVLSSGTHTLSLTHASGAVVDVDAIIITGPPTPTPTPTATNTPTATSTATNTPTATSTTFTTQLTSVNDFNSSVTLALLGLPADATATFATNPLTPTQVL